MSLFYVTLHYSSLNYVYFTVRCIVSDESVCTGVNRGKEDRESAH
jgi:hypothetical protein